MKKIIMALSLCVFSFAAFAGEEKSRILSSDVKEKVITVDYGSWTQTSSCGRTYTVTLIGCFPCSIYDKYSVMGDVQDLIDSWCTPQSITQEFFN